MRCFKAGEGIDDALVYHPAHDRAAPTIFPLEGVSQYIPKQATGRTLAAAAEMAALMRNHSFVVDRDVSLPELNGDYFAPPGRLMMEWYATAIKQ